MRLKDSSVRLDGVHFMLLYAAAVYDWMHQAHGYGEATCTSARDALHVHASTSLHRVGGALDFRFWSIPAERRPAFVAQLRQQLGSAFQVLLEADHIHVELSPAAVVA